MILAAVGGWLTGAFKNRFEATMAMGCQNLKTYARYFDRTRLRLDAWVHLSRHLFIQAGGYEDPDRTVSRDRRGNPTRYQWQAWERLCSAIAEHHQGLGGRAASWDSQESVMELVLCAFDPCLGLGPPEARSPPKDGVQGKVHRRKM